MSIFTVPIGNKELPKEYQSISVDIAELMQTLLRDNPKIYIKELLLCMDNIETVYLDFEDWQKVVFKEKLTYIMNLIKACYKVDC